MSSYANNGIYPKKYISADEAHKILDSVYQLDPENPRWYAGINGKDGVLLFSLKDDSEQSKVKTAIRGKKTNMRLGGANNSKYFDIKIKVKGNYVPFNITTSGCDSYGSLPTDENDFDVCMGGIKPPAGSPEYEEMKARNPDADPRPGEKDVVMLINEYNCNIAPDKETGEVNIPPEARRSKLFEVLNIVSSAISNDMRIAASNGKEFVRFINKLKTSNKSITAADILDKYDEEYPNIRSNNLLLLSNEDKNEIQKIANKDLKVLINEILVLEPKLIPNLCISGDYYKNGDPAFNKYIKLKLMCSATGEITCPIIDIKKSDINNKETMATVVNSDGVEEPLTFNNVHRFVTKGAKIQGNFYTEISITKAGLSFTLKATKISIDISEYKKIEIEEPPLWVPKNTKLRNIDDDSTDGAFENPPEFGIEFNLEDAFNDENEKEDVFNEENKKASSDENEK